MVQILLQTDRALLLWIQDTLRTTWATDFFRVVTHMGDNGAIWIFIGIVLLIPRQSRKIGIMVTCSLLCAFLLNNLFLKNFVGRVRPYEAVGGLTRLIEVQKDFSFPSGHTGICGGGSDFFADAREVWNPCGGFGSTHRIFKDLSGCSLSLRCFVRGTDRYVDCSFRLSGR